MHSCAPAWAATEKAAKGRARSTAQAESKQCCWPAAVTQREMIAMAKSASTKSETGTVVGVDTGYSATKLYTEQEGKHRIMIFPSVTGPAEFSDDFLDLEGESDFIASLSIRPGVVLNFGET